MRKPCVALMNICFIRFLKTKQEGSLILHSNNLFDKKDKIGVIEGRKCLNKHYLPVCLFPLQWIQLSVIPKFCENGQHRYFCLNNWP